MQYPWWLIPQTMTIPQFYAFFAKEPAAENSTHRQLVERANRIRKRRGLPLMPVPESKAAPKAPPQHARFRGR